MSGNFCAWTESPRVGQPVLINQRSCCRGLWSTRFLYTFGQRGATAIWGLISQKPGGQGLPGRPPGLSGAVLLYLMAAFAWCRIIKVPDRPEVLCFQIRGAAPPYVYAVGRGEREPKRWRGELWEMGSCVCGRSSEAPKPLPPGLCFLVHH